ncbi:hypothetical protein [Streptomyces sp. NPDC003863]
MIELGFSVRPGQGDPCAVDLRPLTLIGTPTELIHESGELACRLDNPGKKPIVGNGGYDGPLR